MKTICLVGFRSVASRRVVEALRLEASGTTFVEVNGDLREESALADPVVLVWGGDADGSAMPGRVYGAIDSGLPVVALMPGLELFGLDPAAQQVELCFPPHNGREILVRMQLAESRMGKDAASNMIVQGELIIDCDRYEVTVSGSKVNLTYKEFKLLEYLASNPGRAFTREALLRRVWQYDYFGGTRTVDVHVRRLRSKIENAPHRFIETVWNVGYRFRQAENRAA